MGKKIAMKKKINTGLPILIQIYIFILKKSYKIIKKTYP